MPKMKTHSGAKKRFKHSRFGHILRAYAKKRHNLRKRPQDMKRNARGMCVMSPRDAKVIAHFFPYG